MEEFHKALHVELAKYTWYVAIGTSNQSEMRKYERQMERYTSILVLEGRSKVEQDHPKRIEMESSRWSCGQIMNNEDTTDDIVNGLMDQNTNWNDRNWKGSYHIFEKN